MAHPLSLPVWKDILPSAIYETSQVRSIEQRAYQQLQIPEFDLMQRAGLAGYDVLQSRFASAHKIAVLCGAGNNGGDGLLVARYAKHDGRQADVFLIGDFEKQSATAYQALYLCRQSGVSVHHGLPAALHEYDLIVDALLGIGLNGNVREPYISAIQMINTSARPILALDCPSGLDSQTGMPLGIAVQAQMTVTFIGLKSGLFLGQGLECAGEIYHSALQLPDTLFHMTPAFLHLIAFERLKPLLKPRSRTAHKGLFGHVLVVGGDHGFGGATLLAAHAALRMGAGLVSVATRPEHISGFIAHRPEIMCHGINVPHEMNRLLDTATFVVLGPGLGQSSWSRSLFVKVMERNLPLLVDADGLNLLAQAPATRSNWILTPHPGEAARLLNITNQAIQDDRLAALKKLQDKYQGIVLLKGAGTLIMDQLRQPVISVYDNPGMASGGMGDALSGIIAGLAAQGLPLFQATTLGTCLHGKAGDLAAQQSDRGFLASDVITAARQFFVPYA